MHSVLREHSTEQRLFLLELILFIISDEQAAVEIRDSKNARHLDLQDFKFNIFHRVILKSSNPNYCQLVRI